MELLRILSLAFAALLVVTLAGTLLVIRYYLRRTADTLGEVRAALADVPERAEPFGEAVRPFNEVLARSVDGFASADRELDRARRSLDAIAARRGAGEPAG